MKKVFTLIFLLTMLITVSSAIAADSSPYLSGLWSLIKTTVFNKTIVVGSEAVIANPTNSILQVEAAFFDENGDLCGCDYRTMGPNALWDVKSKDYEEMLFENCDNGMGHLKVIAHQPCRTVASTCTSTVFSRLTDLSGPMLTGFVFVPVNGGMSGVTLNNDTRLDMANIYKKCFDFLKARELRPTGSAE